MMAIYFSLVTVPFCLSIMWFRELETSKLVRDIDETWKLGNLCVTSTLSFLPIVFLS